jgi:L,D-transpeptidase ErfK/SrfK
MVTKIRTLLACSLFWLSVGSAYATPYNLPTTAGDTVIAQYPNEDSHMIAITQADYPDAHPITLLDVAKKFNLGQEEIVRLNPKVDRWLVREGEMVRIPNKRILPDTPRDGVTLNIAEFRMYYYPRNTGQVMSYAHGIGRQDWKTPLGKTKIINKIKNPTWNPPAAIRREHAADGDILPAVVPAGPHNPLGSRALYLGIPGYRIHGTDIDKIYGIGMQITHGCVRMYPEDIEQLYDLVPSGTNVYIVKQPIKVGWLNNVLYIEAHPDLEGENMGKDRRYQIALDLIRKHNGQVLPEFDQKALNDALEKLDGEPVALYERAGGTGSVYVPTAIPDASKTVPANVPEDDLMPLAPEGQPTAPAEQPVAPPPDLDSEPQQPPPPPPAEPVSKITPKTGVKLAATPVAKTATKTTVAGAKPVVKVDNKVAAKPAQKTEAKLAAKVAPKATAQVATKAVPKAGVKVVAVKPAPVTKSVAKAATVKPLPKTEAKVATTPVPKSAVKVKSVVTKPALKSEAKLAPKASAKTSKLS